MGEPVIKSFNWEDPFGLDDQLTDEERMVRDTAENYAQDQLQPRVTEAYLNENFDREIMREMGQLGLLGATVSPEYGGAGLGLCQLRPDRPRGRARRQRLSFGLFGPKLARDAPDQRLRLRRAEAEIPPRPRQRRTGRLFRPDRTRCRFGSRRNAHPRRERLPAAIASRARRCGSPIRRSPTSSSCGRSRKSMAARSAASCSKRA